MLCAHGEAQRSGSWATDLLELVTREAEGGQRRGGRGIRSGQFARRLGRQRALQRATGLAGVLATAAVVTLPAAGLGPGILDGGAAGVVRSCVGAFTFSGGAAEQGRIRRPVASLAVQDALPSGRLPCACKASTCARRAPGRKPDGRPRAKERRARTRQRALRSGWGAWGFWPWRRAEQQHWPLRSSSRKERLSGKMLARLSCTLPRRPVRLEDA